MDGLTPREFKRQREREIRFEIHRRIRLQREAQSTGVRQEKFQRAQAETAQRILFMAKEGRDSFLRWRERKKAEKAWKGRP